MHQVEARVDQRAIQVKNDELDFARIESAGRPNHSLLRIPAPETRLDDSEHVNELRASVGLPPLHPIPELGPELAPASPADRSRLTVVVEMVGKERRVTWSRKISSSNRDPLFPPLTLLQVREELSRQSRLFPHYKGGETRSNLRGGKNEHTEQVHAKGSPVRACAGWHVSAGDYWIG